EVPRRTAMASPGIRRRNRKVRTETPSRVGGRLRSRLARYRPIRGPAHPPLSPAGGEGRRRGGLLVQPGLAQIEDRSVGQVDEPLRARLEADVVTADVEPDEGDAVDQLLLGDRVELLAPGGVGERARPLDGVAGRLVLEGVDEVEVAVVGEVAEE